jgi:hypothetical protein
VSFMLAIDAAAPSPLDYLVIEYRVFCCRPSVEFCRQVAGMIEKDEAIARRLGVRVALVRGWREIGGRCAGTLRQFPSPDACE